MCKEFTEYPHEPPSREYVQKFKGDGRLLWTQTAFVWIDVYNAHFAWSIFKHLMDIVRGLGPEGLGELKGVEIQAVEYVSNIDGWERGKSRERSWWPWT